MGNVEEARKAVDVGVDAIIVQGHEAGGHVIGKVSLIVYSFFIYFKFSIYVLIFHPK